MAETKLTDDDVCAILLAPPEVSNVDLSARFGIAANNASAIRRHQTKRAIRLALGLGLIPRLPVFIPHLGPDNEQAAYVVNGVRQ